MYTGDCGGCGTVGQISLATGAAGSLVTSLEHLISGGNVRSGGKDPCCPPGYNPPKPWPTNANVDGAPPDYRKKGSPMTDPSASGTGRKKDDFCDCIPFPYNGGLWVLGEVRSGKVYTGTPQNLANGVWVEVGADGQPIRVPGHGDVASPTSAASAPGVQLTTTAPVANTQGVALATAGMSGGTKAALAIVGLIVVGGVAHAAMQRR